MPMPRTTGGRPAFIEAKGDILVGKKEKAFYRLIAEAALGRPLPENAVVHHV
jgi:hypothetical protein